MTNDEDDAEDWNWMVLINAEGQHSLWPAVSAIPPGWHTVGPAGTKALCMAYVDAHWTDMRPRNLCD